MNLLDNSSLIKTIDNINEALFFGMKITKSETKKAANFILSRKDTKNAYAGSFGITEKDMKMKAYLFTGEALNFAASRRHVMAEESSRALRGLEKILGKRFPGLKESDAQLLRCVNRAEQNETPKGTFCCGTCTVALWRNINSGGISELKRDLKHGMRYLQSLRDGKSGWKRFPFYYTLLAISEMKIPEAKEEIRYAREKAMSAYKRMRKDSNFYERRKKLIEDIYF